MKTVFLKGLYILSLVMIPEIVFSSSKGDLKSVSPHQYTHLIETYQSQTFEPLSQTALFTEQSASVNSYQTAGVFFISKDKKQVFGSAGSNNTFDDPTGEYCARSGFKVTSCASGLFNQACPYNDKIYDKCCDTSYKYTASQCSYPMKLSSDSCGGKYRCICDTSYYQYTSCNSPKIKGSACTDDSGTYYASCACPSSVSAPYGCEEYHTSPCSTKCKKAKANNCANRTAVQTPYGCKKYFSDCDSKCETAYTDNCRNRVAVSAPNGCESYYSDCQSKCEIAKGDPCNQRTAVSSPYGCKTYFADCSSKCEVAYDDNCHKRTAVDAPYGCMETFSDCSSKCKKAYTDNCHNRTAVIDTCPKAGVICSTFADCSSKIEKIQPSLPILYGDGTVTKEFLTNKTAIGIVFDEDHKLAVALTYAKKDGSAGKESMVWNDKVKQGDNISGLKCESAIVNYTTVCDAPKYCVNSDGRANTDIMLSLEGHSEAATACNLYEPAGCTKDFCKKNKWFLPSVRDFYNISLIFWEMEGIFEILSHSTETNDFESLFNWCSNWDQYVGAWKYSIIHNHSMPSTAVSISPYDYYTRPVVAY